MPSRVYPPEELPVGTTWVCTLNAQDAINQCHVLGISPSTTLSVNRTLLSDFLKTLQLNGGHEPLPKNCRPDLVTIVPVPQAKLDEKAEYGQASTTQVQTTCATLNTITATSPAQPTPLTTPFQVEQNVVVANTSASPGSARLVPDSGRLPHVDWAQLVQDTAIAVGQQVASAMAQSYSPPRVGHSQLKVLEDLVRALPITSGADTHKLVEFLIAATKIAKLRLFTDEDILLAILPRTADQLRAFWLRGISERAKLEQVVENIRDFFLPGQVRHTTVTTMVYRVQQPSESLPEFVESISGASALLMPQFSEFDVLDTVLNGLNGPTRAALAAFPAACSLTDLLALAPRVQVVRALEQGLTVSRPDTMQRSAEYQRPQHSTSTPTNNVSYRRNNNFSRYNNPNFSNSSGRSFAPRIPQYPFNQNQQQSHGANQSTQYQATNYHSSGRNFNQSGYSQGNARGGNR